MSGAESKPTRSAHADRRVDALLPALLIAVYLAAALTTLHSWLAAGFPITGDEPHYLVIARGIIVDHTLEQTVPYREAFEQGLFLGSGITDPPSPANTHAYLGPNGLFNIHNFGLPLLLAVPYAIGGVTAVKVFLVLVGAAGVLLFWKISGVFHRGRWVRALSVAAVGIGMPLVSSSSQIFPDIPAGVLALGGMYWLLTISRRRPVWLEVLFGVGVAYLPLLQIKYAAPAAVLTVALAVAMWRRDGRWRRSAVMVVPFVVLLGILFAYNLYAFANLTGPYEPDAFEFGPATIMVLAGLAFDQNQGVLFQSLVACAGVVGVGLLFARRRAFTVVWMLVIASLVVPNAVLFNHYGGYSYVGRFQYSAALVFGVATLFALSRLAERSRRVFGAVVGSGILSQLLFWLFYTFDDQVLAGAGQVLYNPGMVTWLQNYTLFWYPLEGWLPALYDTGWAATYLPNYAWGLVVVTLLVAGFVVGSRLRGRADRGRRMPVAVFATGGALVVALLVAGFVGRAPIEPIVTSASEFLVAQGDVSGRGVEVSAAGGDEAGPVTTGPGRMLRAGTYTVALTYSSPAEAGSTVGGWQAELADGPSPWSDPLGGTGGASRTVIQTIELENVVPQSVHLETTWNGTSTLTIESITYTLQDG